MHSTRITGHCTQFDEQPCSLGEIATAFEPAFATRTRDEWTVRLAHLDTCVAPVLTPEKAATHPHLRERGTHCFTDGHWQPAAAPRFSRTPASPRGPSPADGEGGAERLAAWRVVA
jgi:alpha-methylacyl-CoA racemase